MATHIVKGVGSANKRDQLVVACMEATTGYTAATGIDVSAADFEPDQHMIGMYLSAGTGNIAVQLPNGGVMTIPFTVDAGENKQAFWGVCVHKLLSLANGTTFNGHIWPVF